MLGIVFLSVFIISHFSDYFLLKMAHIEEPSFQSEWNDLQALRQLSATSGLRQMKPSVTTSVSKKSSNNADEKEAIKRDGQVTFLSIAFARVNFNGPKIYVTKFWYLLNLVIWQKCLMG
jgi:hypothetical protein